MALQQSYPLTLYRDSLRERLQELFSIGVIPSDFLQDIFEKVGIVFFSVGYDEATNTWSLAASLEIDTEVSIQIPGLDQIKLLIGAKPESDSTNLIFNIAINYSDALYVSIQDIEVIIQIDHIDVMQRLAETAEGTYTFDGKKMAPVEGPIRIYSGKGCEFNFSTKGQLSFVGTESWSMDAFCIPFLGIGVDVSGIQMRLSIDDPLPAPLASAGLASDWVGIYFDQLHIFTSEDSVLRGGIDQLVFDHLTLGRGGVSGRITGKWTPQPNNDNTAFTGPGAGNLFGFAFALREVALEVKQNTFVESMIAGAMILPFFDQPVGIDIAVGLDGSFAVALSTWQLSSDAYQSGLVTFEKTNLMRLRVDSLGFQVQNGIFTAQLSGEVTPLFGLDWPSFKVKELSIDSKGNVHLQGGWLNLPNQYHLKFYGCTMEIDKLGFGSTGDGGRWMGFSGAIKLVSGMPAGASVEGLRLTWYEDNRSPQISLNGVGIAFSVPNVLSFEGSVSYDSSKGKFQGGLTLNLISLDMEVDGMAVFEEKQGQTVFAIYLAAEWPAGIPLWSTGLGLYGIQGLFAYNKEPDKHEDEEWYGVGETDGWYHREERGVTNLEKKWKGQPGAMALGAGVTLGTIADNGHAFSGSMLLVIVFPGPVLMIEGKASLLQDRAKLDEEANFRALVVLDARAGTFSAGLDARYQYDNAGRLIDIHGSAEAFFNFNDASAWYLDLGERDPDKRIQAQIFKLFEANSYVMLNAHQLAMGAQIGFNNHWSFGPLSVTLEVGLESNAVVNWHPVHFYGDLHLYGRLVLSAFHFSVGLTAEAYLLAEVFDPFHLKGEVSGRLKLPWPLHSISKTVTLEWGPRPTVPALPAPLLEVSIEHFKTTTSWPLPQGEFLLPADAPPPNKIPVVPLDSRPHVTFSRPVNDDAFAGVNAQPLVPPKERIGDPSKNEGSLIVRYGLSQVALEKQSESTWQMVAKSKEPKERNAADEEDKLFGSWAPLPHMPDGGGPNIGQTKLWLWSKSAFDYTRHIGRAWNEWFTDRYSSYPCVSPVVETCWDFERVAPTASLPNPWQHPEYPGLEFSCEAFDSMSIIELSQPVEGLTHALCVNGLLKATITLPESTNIVKIPVLDSFPSYALFYGYDDQGKAWGPYYRQSSEQTIVEILCGNMTKVGITTAARLIEEGVEGVLDTQDWGIVGCVYVAQRNQLLFVESRAPRTESPSRSRLWALDLNTNSPGSPSLLGTGYFILADIAVTADGTTAYLTEADGPRGGSLLRLDLTKPNLDRREEMVVCSGLVNPQQIALDEAKSTAYVVDVWRLLRIDLGSGEYVPIYKGLRQPCGLLLASDGSTAYIGERGHGDVESFGWLSRVRFGADSTPTHDILYDGLQWPSYMRWANADQTQILLPGMGLDDDLAMLDLSQSPVSMTRHRVDGVPSIKRSLALLPDHQFIVCSSHMVRGYSTQLCLPQVCEVRGNILFKHFEDELAHWSQADIVLEPYTTYRLKITTTLNAEGERELNGYSHDETFTDCAYFRTGSPPALQVLLTPEGPGTAPSVPSELKDLGRYSGLEDLRRYVSKAEAIPDSTPGAYKLRIEFNENYVDQLYARAQRDLVIHLYDNNGLARDANGHLITLKNQWGRVDRLTLKRSDKAWLSVLNQSGCALIDPQDIDPPKQLSTESILAPQTLYEARLVPMLYRESFGSSSFTNSLGSWQAQDLPGTSQSQWQSESESTSEGTAFYVKQTKDNTTSMLLWRPNQREDWSDYQLNVFLRAPTPNPIGVVFRYTDTDSGQYYYRFSLEPPQWRLLKVVAGQETSYDLAFGDFDFVQDTDYLITVEALGSTVQVYQEWGPERHLLFTSTDPDPVLSKGSIGLYCANCPGARFTDVRVEDFRATAPVAYRFTFTTS